MLSRTMHFVIDEIVVFGEVLASVGRCWGIFGVKCGQVGHLFIICGPKWAQVFSSFFQLFLEAFATISRTFWDPGRTFWRMECPSGLR